MTDLQNDQKPDLNHISNVDNPALSDLTIEEVEILAEINGVEAFLCSTDNHWYGFSEVSTDSDSISWLLLDREFLNLVLSTAKKLKKLNRGNTDREWFENLSYII